MRKIKQLSLLLLSMILILGVCGCMNSRGRIQKNILRYLRDKYGAEFSFASDGSSAWPSKTRSYVFADKDGNRFDVHDHGGYLTDNYGSILFDSIATKNVCMDLGLEVKAFIETGSAFFNSTQKFDDYMAYLSECPVITVVVYTTHNYDNDKIANRLKERMNGWTVSAIIYHVDDDIYASINDFAPDVTNVYSDCFWIENNIISDKSWEE